jgi:electron transfer flavoprotein alpha subunit
MAGILVVGEVAGGRLLPASLEAATAGATLAQSLGEPLFGALTGNAGDALDSAAEQFSAGFNTLLVVADASLQHYTAHAQVSAAQALIKICNPSVILCPHTLRAREWAPCLAAALDTGLIMDCTDVTAEGADLVVHKPVHGGGVIGEFVVRGMPRIVTLRSGAFARAATSPNATVERTPFEATLNERVTFIEEITAQAGSGPKVSDAKVVVSGGRGLGSPDNWHYIEQAAATLGAAVGCSRPVADSGWVNSSHQVGLSGNSVNAELYIAIGISGAVQHLAGINSSAIVAAINTDAQADIFTRADYGVVGDYKEVLPAFVERVRQLKG